MSQHENYRLQKITESEKKKHMSYMSEQNRTVAAHVCLPVKICTNVRSHQLKISDTLMTNLGKRQQT